MTTVKYLSNCSVENLKVMVKYITTFSRTYLANLSVILGYHNGIAFNMVLVLRQFYQRNEYGTKIEESELKYRYF